MIINYGVFSYLGACSQIPNFLLNLLNLFIVFKGIGLGRRITTCLFLIAITLIFTIAMVFVNSQEWPFGFFTITMLTVILLNAVNGVYQNSIYGLVADFPARFTNAIITGTNLCGIFVSFFNILLLLLLCNKFFIYVIGHT